MALDLGKQVGPLPLGAWLAVVGTGLGVALWNRNNAPATDATSRDTTTDPLTDVGTGDVGGWTQTTPPTSVPVQEVPTDNDSWGRIAINYLIAQGYDPALSQAAVGHALQGVSMSVREYALWGIALAHFGAPPYPVDVVPPVSVPGPTGGTPTPPAPKPAPKGTWYRIGPGAHWTLHKLAARWYKNPARWRDILAANRDGVRRPQGIAPNPHASPGWIKTNDPDKWIASNAIRWVWIPA